MIRIATILKGSTKIYSLEVNGNFTINGSNTEINSDTVQIKDNIVTLNSGETSNKISKNKAGVEIDRGSGDKYQIIYNEEDSKLKIGLESNLENVATESYVNFATSNHAHTTATQSSNGYMSNADKKKLDGIASGAEVNQNAFANIKVGTTTIQSDAKQDTLELVAGTNISLVGDANNDKVTIGVTGKVASASQADNATNATKATQDSRGQQIDTTYVKGVTGSNATLTVTKGNGSTSKVTVNNVANATNANVVTEKAITGNTLASALPVGMTWSKVYNNGFPCAYGNCLSIRGAGAIQIVTEWSSGDATPANMYYRNARDSSIDKWSAWRTVAHTGGTISNATTASKLGTATVGSGVKPIYLNAGSPAASGSTVGSANRPIYMNGGTLSQCSIDLSTLAPKASPALTGSPTAPTQGTSDNSTKIATTAFVRNLINQFKNDGTLGGISAASLNTNGYVKFSNGFIIQWGYMFKTGNSNAVFTYPITFSNKVIFADYSIKKKEEHQGEHSLGAVTNTSLTINMFQTFESYLYFLVIGY